MQYRHEWKHQISALDAHILRRQLQPIMKQDPHAPNGSYSIRSLYFDDSADTALREKLDGISCRGKFRIRFYNLDPGFIHLEKKIKHAGLGTKESVCLTSRQVEDILAGDIQWMANDPSDLMRELYCKMQQGLRPKTVVDYTREPFIYAPGNVRVTLDHSIRTGLGSVALFDAALPTIAVPDDPIILEVKWDNFLPEIIQNIVQLGSRHAAAFSKYAACRSYD